MIDLNINCIQKNIILKQNNNSSFVKAYGLVRLKNNITVIMSNIKINNKKKNQKQIKIDLIITKQFILNVSCMVF